MGLELTEQLWNETLLAGGRGAFDPEARYRAAANQDTAVARAVPEERAASQGWATRSEIARGGMAVIMSAEQSSLGREVALKVPLAIEGVDTAARMISEAMITAHLAHPNIVPIYDLITMPDGRPGLAMKRIAGVPWSTLLHPTDPTAPRRDIDFHLEVLLRVASAVSFAHSRYVVHNDLKPQNVMVGEFDEILVVDWGIAADYRDQVDPKAIAPHKSTLPVPLGTPRYMPPELAEGRRGDIGPWTDVYLLGAILHEIVTGVPPHRGDSMKEVLKSILTGPFFAFGPQIPESLKDICRRAMARDPKDRYPSAEAFQQALRAFLTHRQSLVISSAALQNFAECEAARRAGPVNRKVLYARYAEILAGFRQARLLWPANPEAKIGEIDARSAFARAALEHGDLGLAESHAAELAEDKELEAGIREARAELARRERSARRVRGSLFISALIISFGLGFGWWMNVEKTRRITESSELAERRLDDIRRLADVKRLRDLQERATKLWPAAPSMVPRLQTWLAEAEELLVRADGHRLRLAIMREGARVQGGQHRFDTAEEQWEHDTLQRLVDELDALRARDVPGIRDRLEFASSVQKLTIEDRAAEWAEVRLGLRDRPEFEGFDLSPQLGLVPIGRDPQSGLYEFAHLASGELPKRDKRGRLEITDATGIVLVLLPGGAFEMGAERPQGSGAKKLGPNQDPRAQKPEGPIHTVKLAPFFMGKYEVTQGQWLRLMAINPSAFKAGQSAGGQAITLRNPVEQVRWDESRDLLARQGLTLPTEAQWEYAARAGTHTVYFTGNDERSLQGHLNIADAYARDAGGPASWVFADFLQDGHVVHAPVGSFRPNRFGLYDTLGNVWEWCSDRLGSYALPVREGSGERIVDVAAGHVFRGGGFRSASVHARSADRYTLYGGDLGGFDIGLRAARIVE